MSIYSKSSWRRTRTVCFLSVKKLAIPAKRNTENIEKYNLSIQDLAITVKKKMKVELKAIVQNMMYTLFFGKCEKSLTKFFKKCI